jgi:hypothetical protein
MDSHARLHAELSRFLRQNCLVCDEHHYVLLVWIVAGDEGTLGQKGVR